MDGPGRLRLRRIGTDGAGDTPGDRSGGARAGRAVWCRAGLAVEVADDVAALVWGKLAINAAINPLTALLRVPNGALLESEWAR